MNCAVYRDVAHSRALLWNLHLIPEPQEEDRERQTGRQREREGERKRERSMGREGR
jgi:hypothetical protein